jgi:branched-chain amino acid aminotransferase
MNECYGKNFVLNGELQPVVLFDKSHVYEGDSIYEVIRLVKGTPVFFHDHMERLTRSIRLKHKSQITTVASIRKAIINLGRSDRKKEINIKIVLNYKKEENNWLVYYIDSFYPTEEQYRNGAKGILFNAVRKDPASKVINFSLKSTISHRLIAEGGYEALLVNEDNLITEGSRSNIFFIKGETLVTAPDNMILSGITRKHVLDICSENGINVEMRCVRTDEIGGFDAVFMSGTSPMVLLFNSIGNIHFNVNVPLVKRIRELYMARVEESLKKFRTE